MFSRELGQMIVSDLMRRWPETVPVFLRRRMSCPGCPLSPFMTLEAAAQEYGISLEVLSQEMLASIEISAGEH